MKFIIQGLRAARSPVPRALKASLLLVVLTLSPYVIHAEEVPMTKPTVVLVHGAFAESSSWNRVTAKLLKKGYPVVAQANPLRGVKSDAGYLSSLIDTIHGPIILVGHSYGGTVITVAAAGKSNVKALIYVSGLAPDLEKPRPGSSASFPAAPWGPPSLPPCHWPMAVRTCTSRRTSFTRSSARTCPRARPSCWQRPNDRFPRRRSTKRRELQRGKPFRHGFSMEAWIRTFHPPCTPSWRSGPVPRKQWRSAEHRMW